MFSLPPIALLVALALVVKVRDVVVGDPTYSIGELIKVPPEGLAWQSYAAIVPGFIAGLAIYNVTW